MQRWSSGLRHTLGKRANCNRFRRFESSSLRQKGNCRAFARFFLQKNTSLFRPQFPFYRPNAKLAKQFRSVLSCEVVATKKNFVGNLLLLGFELSVKKIASGKFFSAGMKACIDPRRTTFKAEQIPLSAPRKKREYVSSLKIVFVVLPRILATIFEISCNTAYAEKKERMLTHSLFFLAFFVECFFIFISV